MSLNPVQHSTVFHCPAFRCVYMMHLHGHCTYMYILRTVSTTSSLHNVHAGGVMEHWLRDEAVDRCMKCNVEFTFTDRKHHCRDCGKIFCHRSVV